MIFPLLLSYKIMKIKPFKTNKTASTPPLIPSERFVHQMQRSPFLDWIIILSTAVTLAIILVGVGVSVYLGTGDSISAPAASAPQNSALPLSVNALQRVLSDFDTRAAQHASLTKSYDAPKDPSLP